MTTGHVHSDDPTPGDGGDGRREPTRFERSLAALKRDGAAVLVTGAVPDEAYARVSRRLLGAGDGPARRRLVVLPDAGHGVAADRLRGSGPLGPDHAVVVSPSGVSRNGTATHAGDGGRHGHDYDHGHGSTRGATTPATPGTPPEPAGGPRLRSVGGRPGEVGAAVSEELERLETAADGFDPTECRVGFDYLSGLRAAHGDDVSFGFLYTLRGQVRSLEGLLHVRLLRPRDTEAVRTFEPLFDATLELRANGAGLEQRWHLEDGEIVSDWLAVSDPTEPDG
jgi:hypothetical protein